MNKQCTARNRILRPAVAAITAALAATPGVSMELEEVVVTAQKREQSVQDVSITINTFSGDMLQEMGLFNSNQLAAKVPNLNIHSPAGEGGVAVVFMRGVGLNDFATNNTGPVGFYIDEVFAGSSNAQVTTLFDVQRVEVLKGPQGTLYGRNTTGGALNIISNKPTDELEGYLRANYGDYDTGNDEYKLEAVISGPLSEQLRGRLAVSHYNSDGYMKNLINGEYVEKENTAARLLLDWTPSDTVDVLLNVHASENDSDADLYHGSLDEDFYEGVSDIEPILDVEQNGVSLRVNWDLGDSITLTSISAWDELDKTHQEDADMLPLTIIHTEYGVETDTISQELRLTGDTESMHWIGGLYYWYDELEQDQWVDLSGAGLPIPYVYDNDQETTTWAAFGQVEYDLTDTLVLTAGLRYTYLEVDFDSVGSGTIMLDSSSPTGFSNSYTFSDDLDEDSVSGRVALDWNLSDDVMVYGSIAKGFKGAGFNGNFHVDVDGIGSYDSEDLWAYEIGAKSTLADGTLQLNGAIFYYDYSDAQIFNGAPIPDFGLPAGRINNGDISIQGLDVDLVWQPTSALYIQLGLGYTDGEYDEDILDEVTGLMPIEGNQLQNTPEWSAFGLVNYEWSLGDAGFIAAQVDASWSDDVYYDNFEDSVIGQDAYTITNARLSYRPASEHYELALWGKNLGDEEYATYAFDLRPDFGFVQFMRGVPRTLGIEARLNF